VETGDGSSNLGGRSESKREISLGGLLDFKKTHLHSPVSSTGENTTRVCNSIHTMD
jgi:hypothetical protein